MRESAMSAEGCTTLPSRGLRVALARATFSAIAFAGTTIAVQAAVDISDQPTKNMSCSAGVCTPTAKRAVLNVDHLVHLLGQSDVKIVTGTGAVTIQVSAALAWATANRLTLDANCNVIFKAPVTVAGTGAMTIVTNDGGSGCDLLFFPDGKVDFWDLSSRLVINGKPYILVGDVRTLVIDAMTMRHDSFAFANDFNAGADRALPPESQNYKAFEGTFEGLGHTISNLKIDDGVGLFRASEGVIRDITLRGVTVTIGKKDLVAGGLVGSNLGMLVGDFVDGTVTQTDIRAAGVLAGWSSGSIIRCGTSGTVAGTYAGGLVGQSTGSIDGSYSSAKVTGHASGNDYSIAGGLVGLSQGPISNSHATGDVESDSRFAGGLVGENDKVIVRGFATGNVSEPLVGGGLAGYNGGEIQESFANGSVKASLYGGGACGSVGWLHRQFLRGGRHDRGQW
jgi:hypothetical protein